MSGLGVKGPVYHTKDFALWAVGRTGTFCPVKRFYEHAVKTLLP